MKHNSFFVLFVLFGFFCSEGSCTEFLPVAVISCSEVCALEANEGKELKGKIYRDICHI